MADFVQTLITTLEVGSLYALIALGYTMVYGILKFINFAHSDIVVLGAWISFTLSSWILPAIGLDPHNPATPPPIWVGGVILVAAMIACGIIGFCDRTAGLPAAAERAAAQRADHGDRRVAVAAERRAARFRVRTEPAEDAGAAAELERVQLSISPAATARVKSRSGWWT